MKIIKRTALVVAFCVLLPTLPAYAANWVYVVTDPDNAVVYYDSDTLQRTGDEVIVWVKWDHSRDKTVKERESKDRAIYDCSAGTRTVLSIWDYFPNGEVNSIEYKPSEQTAKSVPPDSMGETIMQAVCAAPPR